MHITKKVHGCTYYLKRESNGFSWQGLRENGTRFTKEEYDRISLRMKLDEHIKQVIKKTKLKIGV